MKAPRSDIRRQRGVAVLLLMLGVLIATVTALLASLSRNDLKTRRLEDTRASMAEAKQALIEFAVVNPDANPGQSISLPCPDLDGGGGYPEGEAHANDCGVIGESMLGRLPWRTLGAPVLRDAAGACLWYAVSGSYKSAGAATASMINTDSNGQIQLMTLDTGSIVEGILPEDRPVAMIVAAQRTLPGQTRPAAAGNQCSTSFAAADFLDTDGTGGLSNSSLTGIPDNVDVMGYYPAPNAAHNDRIVTISRREIAARVHRRPDFESGMRSLGLAVAACVAAYAESNPGGNDDKRLPWPAPVALADYRDDSAYDDGSGGAYSGRLPDAVDDSSTATGNPVNDVLSDCDPLAVPQWSAVNLARWRHWKDHFFYAVAESYAPAASAPSNCGDCLSVNGAGKYAAVVMFANARLDALGQVRNAPPTDADTRGDVANYLEDGNAANVPGGGGTADYVSQAASGSFNDILFCIDKNLKVTEC